MLSTFSLILSVFTLVLHGVSVPDDSFWPSLRPDSGRKAVLSLPGSGARSPPTQLAAVAVVFWAAPLLPLLRGSSLSWLAFSVNLSGRLSRRAQGHDLDCPRIAGSSPVVYSLGFLRMMGAEVFWVAPSPLLQWCYVSPKSAALVHSWCTLWPFFSRLTAVDWLRQLGRSSYRPPFTRSVFFLLSNFDMETMPSPRLCLTVIFVWQVFQRWRIRPERGLHCPPQPWRLVPPPDFSERFSVPFLDSGNRTRVGRVLSGVQIWVGSFSYFSPIGNPFILVGRLTQSWKHLGDPVTLMGRMIHFRRLVDDWSWADLPIIYICLGWPPLLLDYIPLPCRDTPAQSPLYYVDHSSLGLPTQPFDWTLLFRAQWYQSPFLPRIAPPLVSWRPLLPGLCPYLSRWFPCYAHLHLSLFFSFLLQHMAAELIQSMENLQFTEEESESVVVESPREAGDSELWLVGSVISSKAVDGDSVCRIFRSVWKSKNIIEILELRPNFFLIKPVGAEAKGMILKRRPWVVHEDLFSIEPYNPEWHAADFTFTSMVIWVWVYQLPLRAMNGNTGLQLGGSIGKAIGVDHRVEGGNLGEFLRIRVSIDITKPLRRCILLGNGQGKKPSPCPLKYERLPRFCYYCGLIGHDLAACLTKPSDLDSRKLQYGSWLRVSTQKPVASRRRQGIEYFDTRGEAAVAVGVTEGQSSVRAEAAGNKDSSVEATPTGVDGNLDNLSGTYSVEQVFVAQAPPTAGNVATPYGHAGSIQTDQPCPAVIATFPDSHEQVGGAVDATVPVLHEQVGGAAPKTPLPADKGDVSEGGTGAVAPEPGLVTEEVDPTTSKQDAGLGKSTGDMHVEGTAPVLHKQDAVGSEPILAKGNMDSHDPLLPMHAAGTTKPTLPMQHVDANEPVRAKQAAEMESPAMGVAPTRAKRSLQGKYEVCTPFQPKRTHLHSPGSSSLPASDSKITGMSSLNYSTEVAGKLHLVFLCETRLKQSSSSRIQHALNMEGCFVVEYGNGCTGLMVLWNKKINVSLLSYSSIHIDVNVASDSGSFHFSGLHGHCIDKLKHLTWSTIDRLRSSSALPWLVGGDINEILCHSEKEEGRRKLPGFLDTFRDCLDRNHLIDCKPISGWFTWLYTNSVSGSVIQERLDRYLATTDWFSLFPDYRVSSFFTAKSDHCFLLMDTTQAVPVKGGTRDYFRFDSCWSKEEDCIERGTITDEAKTAFLEAKREHKSLLDKDEAYWAQRARVTWLTHRDRNTAYFHARATGRRKKNRIRGLFDESSIWTDKQAEVAGVAMRYFSTIFSSSQPTPNSSLLSNIAPCISFDDNSYLLRPFTDAEILAAFQDINPTKAPGIDGLPGSFFWQHWELIGPDILRLCHDLLSRKIDMSCVNATVITLIPKVEDPVRMQQLRPISLCTVVYKIVSKTILNRMKPLLPGCISENQSAFLKGRLISDNILVAHELLHYLCSSKNGPNKGAALKLDMEKAFDRVEWTFLRSVLLRLGFHSDWVDLLMDCVSTVSYRIRINGRLSPVLIPQRGLRQGDPLSPFLFVICMQGLSATLLAEQAAGRIMGIRASQKGPRVNHLLYADDSVVFIRNSEREASRLKEVLRLFADSSGQRINFGKSTVFYSPSTPSADRHRISAILGIVEVFDPGIYLGVPLRVGKNKTNIFGFLNEKVDDRVSGWTKRLLSFGGREIFLKSVAQALPLYIMSCYLLPRTITDCITSSMRRYWWSGKLSERGWPLLAWDKICTPKNAGGLGLRDLRRFNLALLGKQLWRFLVLPDSLVSIVFRAKYYHSGSLLDAGLPDHASYAWKGLHSALQELRAEGCPISARQRRMISFRSAGGGGNGFLCCNELVNVEGFFPLVVFQRWRFWSERGLHSPPPPWWLIFPPDSSERFPVLFLDSRTRIRVGSGSSLSPIGNPFALVGRLIQLRNHVGDPFVLVGRLIQLRSHVGDRYSFPLLPRGTLPLASWRPMLHGLCPYLSRCFLWSIPLSFSSHLQHMASELIQSMENLQFTEEESESVVVESPCEAGDSGLWHVGSVISSKDVDGDSVCRIFRSVWKSKNITEILELRPNFFLIKPVGAAAKDMILKRRPWVIHEDLFSIEPYNPKWRAVDFIFTNMVIWVRVYQLPLRAMNGTTGLQLGGTIGKAIRVDHRVEGGNLGEFLRIRVSIDITKPLRRCILLGNGQGRKPSPCPLKYERWLRVSTQKPVVGSRRKQGIEYFNTSGEAAEAVGVAEGQSSVRAEGPSTVEQGSATQVPHVDATVTDVHEQVGGAEPKVPRPVDKGEVFEGCHEVVAPELDLATEIVDPTMPMQAAGLEKSTGGLHVVNTEPVLHKQTVVDTEPVLSKQNVDFSEPLLPKQAGGNTEPVLPKPCVDANEPVRAKQAAGNTEPVLPKPCVDANEPVRAKQAAVMENPTMGVSPTRAKRSLQGKYESKLSDGGCRDVRATPSSIMRTICWNCRGIRNSSTVRFLGDFVAQHTPALVFLCETRLCNSSNPRIKASLGMDCCFTVDFGNGCNGLMLLWNNEINVNLLSYSATHIDATVDSPTGSFRFTGIHGYYTESMKHLNWSLFDRLWQASSLPWLIRGDFNELLCHSEKEGGRRKPRGLIDNFRECLHRNDLFDYKLSSGWCTFTYTNGSHGTIRERLDRFVASPDWLSRHPFFRATSSFTAKSDHCILLMDSDPIVGNGSSRRGAIDKLSAVGGALRNCQHNRRKSTTKRIGELQRFLDSCMHSHMTVSEQSVFLSAKAEHKALLDKDEQYWAQRSRVSWLRYGDRNSAYFHARASGRKKKSRIRGLFDEANVWTDTPDEAADVAVRYFEALFTSSQPQSPSTILDLITPTVDSEMNNTLLLPFTNDEILFAFQGIDPGKAPGIDGLPESFFRQH
ncbi:hypothetical protein GQ457_12G013690 [Hibiscus cannabinus]